MSNYFIMKDLPIKNTGMLMIATNDQEYKDLLKIYENGKK